MRCSLGVTTAVCADYVPTPIRQLYAARACCSTHRRQLPLRCVVTDGRPGSLLLRRIRRFASRSARRRRAAGTPARRRLDRLGAGGHTARHRQLWLAAGVSYLPDESEPDAREEAAAREAAGRGVATAEGRGWVATARVERAVEPVWQTVVWVAEEIGASLIVCGARGRNAAKRALLGSVAEAVLHHSHRPTLIAPQPDPAD